MFVQAHVWVRYGHSQLAQADGREVRRLQVCERLLQNTLKSVHIRRGQVVSWVERPDSQSQDGDHNADQTYQ